MFSEKILFNLISNEVLGNALPDGFCLPEKDFESLYRLSKQHEIAHLVGNALLNNNLLPTGKVGNAFKDQIMFAVYIYEQQNARLKKVIDIFEREKIANIPLKGVEIRKLYKEPWMRNSCDIDILVREEDADRATKVLIDSGFKSNGKKGFHDIHLSFGDVNLELHFNILENVRQIDGVLSEVWDHTEKVTEYCYRETPEYFVFHHIAHMAYHFIAGGCGIRPLLDLKILQINNFYDETKLMPLLEKSQLVTFYETIKQLVGVWFNGGEYTEILKSVEQYILTGGVYGTRDNRTLTGVALNRQNKKRYLFKLAFPAYNLMCGQYPVLRKHKWLLPFCYIGRLFRKTFGKDRKRVHKQIKSTFAYSDERIEQTNALLKSLNLSK